MAEEKSQSTRMDEVFENVRKSEEALLEAGRKFAEAVADAVPGAPEAAHRIIDQAFSFTERLLSTQREFARSVIDTLPGRSHQTGASDTDKTGGSTSSTSSTSS